MPLRRERAVLPPAGLRALPRCSSWPPASGLPPLVRSVHGSCRLPNAMMPPCSTRAARRLVIPARNVRPILTPRSSSSLGSSPRASAFPHTASIRSMTCIAFRTSASSSRGAADGSRGSCSASLSSTSANSAASSRDAPPWCRSPRRSFSQRPRASGACSPSAAGECFLMPRRRRPLDWDETGKKGTKRAREPLAGHGLA